MSAKPGQDNQAASARAVSEIFFDRYNKQDVPGMVDLFEPEGTVEYVPFSLSGPVEDIGPGSWGVLVGSFPDLRNEIRSIRETDDGHGAFIDVDIMGTQTKEAFGVPSKGRSYRVRHLFVVKLNESGRISHMTAFWDNADWYSQLGKTMLS